MHQSLLNRHEVIQGPSPKVLKVLRNFKPAHASCYINGYYNSILVPKISKIFKIPTNQIILSYGEEDFFRTVFDKLDPKIDSVLTHQIHYTYCDEYLNFKNIPLHIFKTREKENKFTLDVQDCIKQCKLYKPKILLLASPNNPTGNPISQVELKKILSDVPSKTLVIVDEAYWGFDKNYKQAKFLSLLHKYKNLAYLRTFSKLYALAGLRIGFALCGKNVKKMLNYQDRYLGLSRILEEVAVAALESGDYYQKLSRLIIANREWFISHVNKLPDCQAFNSRGNFTVVRLKNKTAKALKIALKKEKIIICKFISRNLLRVTVSNPKHTQNFFKLLLRISNAG